MNNTKVIHVRDLLLRMDETIGSRLQRLRKEKMLTQVQLGKLAGVGQSAIANIEKDIRGYGKSVVALAKALGTTTDYLQMEKAEIEGATAWPFDLFTPTEYLMLTEKERREFENSIAGAILRVKKTAKRA